MQTTCRNHQRQITVGNELGISGSPLLKLPVVQLQRKCFSFDSLFFPEYAGFLIPAVEVVITNQRQFQPLIFYKFQLFQVFQYQAVQSRLLYQLCPLLKPLSGGCPENRRQYQQTVLFCPVADIYIFRQPFKIQLFAGQIDCLYLRKIQHLRQILCPLQLYPKRKMSWLLCLFVRIPACPVACKRLPYISGCSVRSCRTLLCQLLQGLPPHPVQLPVGAEDIAVHLYCELSEYKGGIPGLHKLLADIRLRHRLILRRLAGLALHAHLCVPIPHRKLRRSIQGNAEAAFDGFLLIPVQIFFSNLLQQRLVSLLFLHGLLSLLLKMTGSGQGNHIAAIVYLIIASGKSAPVIKCLQFPVILRIHTVFLRSIFQVMIQIFPINAHYACRVLGSLHPPFDFQGADACRQNFRQDLNGTHILGA